MRQKLVLILGLAVLLQIASCGPFQKTISVKFVGTPNDPSLGYWIQENLLPKLTNPKVSWDGTITITNLGKLGGYSDATVCFDIWGDIDHVELHSVTIDDSLNPELEHLTVKKEVLAHYVFLSWWLDNTSYIQAASPDFRTLMDGMGYNFLATEISVYYPYLVQWDGVQTPTCEQLRAIDKLYQENHVAGNGVGNLLLQCSTPKQSFLKRLI